MATALKHSFSRPVTASEDAPLPCSAREFERLAAQYPDLRMEMSAEGDITLMAPAHSETGRSNFNLAVQLGQWIKQGGGGIGFDSSTGFTMPSGAVISPDIAWVEASRWQTLSPDAHKGFVALVPDFVIELRSPSDRLSTLQKKMRHYLASGIKLGWLLDPRLMRVEVYLPGQAVQVLLDPKTVSADPLLPGFALDLSEIFT